MDISVIIVNYNTLDITKKCIDSVFEKAKDIEFEVILVDNQSLDGSKDFFSHDSRITYIYNSDNYGFGRANNIGYKYATGRNILFLNSDTLLVNNAIKILSDYLDNTPQAGGCGGNLYNKDLTPNMSFKMHFPTWLWEMDAVFHGIPSRLLRINNQIFNYSNDVVKVAYIMGADLMVKRSVLEESGLFDDDFFMYFEETELCHRIYEHNYFVASVPHAKIIHLDGQSTKKHKGPSSVYLKSNFLYIEKTDNNVIIKRIHKALLKFRFYYHRLFNLWDK